MHVHTQTHIHPNTNTEHVYEKKVHFSMRSDWNTPKKQ